MEPSRRHLDSYQFADVYPFVILTETDARRLSAVEVRPADIAVVRSPLAEAGVPETMSTDNMIRIVAAGTRLFDLGRLEQALADLGVLVSQAELEAIGCRLPLQLDDEGGRLARFDLGVLPALIRDGELLPAPDDRSGAPGKRHG